MVCNLQSLALVDECHLSGIVVRWTCMAAMEGALRQLKALLAPGLAGMMELVGKLMLEATSWKETTDFAVEFGQARTGFLLHWNAM